jgi:hypothetical protein
MQRKPSMEKTRRDTYCTWVRNALTALGPSSPNSVYEWIRLNESVPFAELTHLTSDGHSKFEKDVRFAKWKMKREGVVISPKWGIWTLAAAN